MEELQQVFVATYEPRINYYLADFDEPDSYPKESTGDLISIINSLEEILSARVHTGNKAKAWFKEQLSSLCEEEADILKRVLKRDLRCGVSSSTINKIWPDLIYVHPYMRCNGLSEKTLSKISFPCYSQTKEDGLYCDIVVRNDSVTYMSRSGSILNLNEESRDKALISLVESTGEFVLQGEALVIAEEFEEFVPREESNGYINSDDIDIKKIQFQLWDCVPLDSWLKKSCEFPYDIRLNSLYSVMSQLEEEGDYNLDVVDTKICLNVDDIISDFSDKRSKKKEGVIIKDGSGLWADGTSSHQIKVKVIMEIDLKVIGYKMGRAGTRTQGVIGSVLLSSSDGLLEVSVGSLKDKQRVDFMKSIDDWIAKGQIFTIKVNGVQKNKTGGKHSAFLPRLKEVRIDKTEADSYEQILKQEEEFTDMLKLIKMKGE